MNASRKSGVADTIPFNNAAERAMRPLALGRKNYLFAGSDEGGRRAAIIYTSIETARLNDVDPEAWLGDVISRIADHPNTKIDELLPWKWTRLLVRRRSPHSGLAAVTSRLHLRRHNGVPKAQFPLYLKECEWRFNHRPANRLLATLKTWLNETRSVPI